MDIVNKQKRSKMMAGIKSKNTKPEMRVRKLLFSKGYRFRLHRKDIPGCPDIVLQKHNLCIFVHGCYWHRHASCRLAYNPKSKIQFWRRKFSENIQRDLKNQSILMSKGWRILIVWECAARAMNDELLLKLLSDSIGIDVPYQEILYKN